MIRAAAAEGWSWRHGAGLAAVFSAGVAVRILLLPSPGLVGDIDQFVLWVHGIAVNGLATTYDQNVTFPPVMAYIWGALAAVEPAFRTVTDSSDPGIRAIMKMPASVADLGMAGLMAYAFRARPRWAIVAATVVLLHPAIVDVSAWWGQYESIYLVSALAAVLLAVNGRNGPAAVAIAISLMTKPQALPFILPFAAWFWTHGGWRELARTAAIGLAVIVVLWLPFIAAGGPLAYLHNLAVYQNEIFPILSLHAWNIWWILQVLAVGGLAADDVAIIGPVTFRHIGFLITGLLSLVVVVVMLRDHRPRTFVMALAVSTLIWFEFLTQMHERYAYGALVFLLLLIDEPRLRWLFVAFSIVFTLDLWSAAPPSAGLETWLPFAGPASIAGSVAMVLVTASVIQQLGSRPRNSAANRDDREAAMGSDV